MQRRKNPVFFSIQTGQKSETTNFLGLEDEISP